MKYKVNKVLILLLVLSITYCSMGTVVSAERGSNPLVSISDIYEGDETIRGTGKPGAQIKIEFSDGTIIDTVVEADGSWEGNIPTEVMLVAGITVTVTHTVNMEPDGDIVVKNLSRTSSLARVGDILQYTTSLWNPEPDTVLEQVYFTHIFPDTVELLEETQDVGDRPILYKNGAELSEYMYGYDDQTKNLSLLIDSLSNEDKYEFIYCVRVTGAFNSTITGSAKVVADPEITTLTATVLGTESGNENSYEVSYNFISGTEGKELPEEVMALLPQNQTDATNGTTVIPSELSQTEVAVEDGTWEFKHWDKDNAVIDDADVIFTGTWVFTEKEVSDPNPSESGATGTSPTDPPKAEIKESVADSVAKVPMTGDNTNMTLLFVMAGLSLLSAGFLIRKKNMDN